MNSVMQVSILLTLVALVIECKGCKSNTVCGVEKCKERCKIYYYPGFVLCLECDKSVKVNSKVRSLSNVLDVRFS